MTDTPTKAIPTGSGIDFEIYSNTEGLPVSTGTLTEVQWNIAEYQGGVLMGNNSGTLAAGDPMVTNSYTSGDATYLVRLTYVYDDGAFQVMVTPYERVGISVNTAMYDTPVLSLNCRSAVLEVLNLIVSGGRSSTEVWLDSSFTIIDTGDTFLGDIPDTPPMGFPNLVYSMGLDVTEWTDLDPALNAYEIGAIGWVTPDCT